MISIYRSFTISPSPNGHRLLIFQILEINWTGMTNILDSPAFRCLLLSDSRGARPVRPHQSPVSPSLDPFSSLSEGTIMDIIASLMVLPNRMCFPLIEQVKVDQMRFPLPRVRRRRRRPRPRIGARDTLRC